MGSVPRGDTGVGSSTNGTFMQVGGALGVAVIGSELATRYTGRMTSTLAPYHLPQAVEGRILGSVGGAPSVAARIGGSTGALLPHAARIGGSTGALLPHAARIAFISGMDLGLTIGAAVGPAGAIIALAAFPSRPRSATSGAPGTGGLPGRAGPPGLMSQPRPGGCPLETPPEDGGNVPGPPPVGHLRQAVKRGGTTMKKFWMLASAGAAVAVCAALLAGKDDIRRFRRMRDM